jgi:hypothetical protein
VKVDGKAVPLISKMTIVDAKNPELVSELIYSKPSSASVSPSEFNVSNLTK